MSAASIARARIVVASPALLALPRNPRWNTPCTMLAEREYVAWYCERTGRDSIPHWPFYLAFSFFRSASIVQGVFHRGLRGNASSAGDAATMRARAVEAADTGYRLSQFSAL